MKILFLYNQLHIYHKKNSEMILRIICALNSPVQPNNAFEKGRKIF